MRAERCSMRKRKYIFRGCCNSNWLQLGEWQAVQCASNQMNARMCEYRRVSTLGNEKLNWFRVALFFLFVTFILARQRLTADSVRVLFSCFLLNEQRNDKYTNHVNANESNEITQTKTERNEHNVFSATERWRRCAACTKQRAMRGVNRNIVNL